MKIFIPLAFAFALALGLIFVPPTMLSNAYADASMSQPRVSPIIPGEYIVFLEPSFVGKNVTTSGNVTSMSTTISSPESNHTLKKAEQMTIIEADRVAEQIEPQGGNVTSIYTYAFNGFSLAGVKDVTPLIQDPAIESIEPNTIKYQQAQYMDNGINRADLDKAIGSTGGVASKPDNRESRPNVDVAVIDGPTPDMHPDLNIVKRVNMIDGCGTRKIDTVTIQCNGPTGDDHGTAVAGLVGAKDNLGGAVGGLPGARITSLGACYKIPAGACDGAAIMAAWNYVVANAGTIEIATMSIGGGTVTSAMISAGQNIIDAGVTFFTAAGNGNNNVNNGAYCGVSAFICVSALGDTNGKCGGGGPATPTYQVGGSDVDDSRAPFSSFGSAVDIMTSGVQQLTTAPGDVPTEAPHTSYYPGGFPYIGTSEQGKYTDSFGGTSGATPLAAGIGALLKSKNPGWGPATIKSQLQADAVPQTQSCDGFGKGGLVKGANSESSEKILYAGNY